MGLATAKVLLENDYKVVIAGRAKDKLIPISDQWGAECSYAVVDASNAEELKRTLSSFSSLDHLVVAVSAKAHARGIADTSEEEAKQAFQRFWISYNVLHLATKCLSRTGSVTLISGSSGKSPLKGYGV